MYWVGGRGRVFRQAVDWTKAVELALGCRQDDYPEMELDEDVVGTRTLFDLSPPTLTLYVISRCYAILYDTFDHQVASSVLFRT